MSWLLAYLLLLIIIILMFWVGLKKDATWKGRFKGWGLLLLPVAIYMWDYPVVYYQHVRDCKADGGLKILIQSENTDQIQLEGGSYGESFAQDALRHFYPRLTLVETIGDIHKQERDLNGYFAYSVSRIPQDPPGVGGGYATPWTYNKIALQKPSDDLYIIFNRHEHDKSAHREKTESLLMRNGRIYAKWTEFRHYWTGIRYPDAVPDWRCYDINSTHKVPEFALIELLLK